MGSTTFRIEDGSCNAEGKLLSGASRVLLQLRGFHLEPLAPTFKLKVANKLESFKISIDLASAF